MAFVHITCEGCLSTVKIGASYMIYGAPGYYCRGCFEVREYGATAIQNPPPLKYPGDPALAARIEAFVPNVAFLPDEPKCDCGAASVGAQAFKPGHSDWCAVAEGKR